MNGITEPGNQKEAKNMCKIYMGFLMIATYK